MMITGVSTIWIRCDRYYSSRLPCLPVEMRVSVAVTIYMYELYIYIYLFMTELDVLLSRGFIVRNRVASSTHKDSTNSWAKMATEYLCVFIYLYIFSNSDGAKRVGWASHCLCASMPSGAHNLWAPIPSGSQPVGLYAQEWRTHLQTKRKKRCSAARASTDRSVLSESHS